METETELFAPRTGAGWRDSDVMYENLRKRAPIHRVPDNGEGEDYYIFSTPCGRV